MGESFFFYVNLISNFLHFAVLVEGIKNLFHLILLLSNIFCLIFHTLKPYMEYCKIIEFPSTISIDVFQCIKNLKPIKKNHAHFAFKKSVNFNCCGKSWYGYKRDTLNIKHCTWEKIIFQLRLLLFPLLIFIYRVPQSKWYTF
jgi:hypothetical protein